MKKYFWLVSTVITWLILILDLESDVRMLIIAFSLSLIFMIMSPRGPGKIIAIVSLVIVTMWFVLLIAFIRYTFGH